MKRITTAFLIGLMVAPAAANEPEVLGVNVTRNGDGSYRFDVTVRHDDTGWDHYADKWEILGPGGAVLATRVLLHPHETEQPFTRSLPNVRLPAGLTKVTIRAHDKVHGYGERTFTVELR